MCCAAPALPFRVPEKIVQHRRHRSHQFPRPCQTFATKHISRSQTGAPDDAWEEEITGWNPRSTRDPSISSSFSPQQPATSRLGSDVVPPSRPVRTDDEMSVQEHETTHVPFKHPSASETIPSDVPVTLVELEDSEQTTSMRCISFKRRVEPPKRTRSDDDDHSALFSACHHDLEKVSENLKDGKRVFSGT